MSKYLTLQQKIDKVNQKLTNEGFDGKLGVHYFGNLGELVLTTKTGGYFTHYAATASWSQKDLYELAKKTVKKVQA